MERLLCIDEARRTQILTEAVEKAYPCSLSTRGKRGWQTFKSGFVGGEPATGTMVVESPDADPDFPIEDWQPGRHVGVSFRRGHKKCMFSTVVMERQTDGPSKTLTLRWPDQLQELQRRAYYRATPPNKRILVRFWPGGVAARANLDDQTGVLSGTLQDLSAGGMRICAESVQPGEFQEGEAFACAFTPRPRGETFILECTFRHAQPEQNNQMSVGLQFVGLEASEEGRETLARIASIVTDFHRGQVRQGRMRRPRGAGSQSR